MQHEDVVEIVQHINLDKWPMNDKELAFFKVGTKHRVLGPSISMLDGVLLDGPTGECPFHLSELKLVDV